MAVDLAGPRARVLAEYHEAVVLRDWTLRSEDFQTFTFRGDVVSRHPVWSRSAPLTLEVPIPNSQTAWRWKLPSVASLEGDDVNITVAGMPERIPVSGGSGPGPTSPPAGEVLAWRRGS